MMTSQMVAAIWIGMRIFPLRASPLVLSGGGQYAESHRGIFRLLYSNGIGDITSLQALENLTLLLKKRINKKLSGIFALQPILTDQTKDNFLFQSRFEILLTDTNYKVKTKQSRKKRDFFFKLHICELVARSFEKMEQSKFQTVLSASLFRQ